MKGICNIKMEAAHITAQFKKVMEDRCWQVAETCRSVLNTYMRLQCCKVKFCEYSVSKDGKQCWKITLDTKKGVFNHRLIKRCCMLCCGCASDDVWVTEYPGLTDATDTFEVRVTIPHTIYDK